MSTKGMQDHPPRKRRFLAYLPVALLIFLSVAVLFLGDLMEVIPLFAPLVASPIFPFFHEIHDLLAVAVVLYAAYKYHACLGVAAILLYLAAHIPYVVVRFPEDAPEFLRIIFGGFVALLGVWLIDRLHKTAKLVRRFQEYLQLQVERMPIGLIVWNADFRVQLWNPAAEKIFGFSREETLGKHPYDLIVPKGVQPHVDDIWRRLLEGDTTAHSINENTTKDGRTIICDWLNTPLRRDDGSVLGVLSMVQDITESKLAEEIIAHLTAVLRAIRNVNQLITHEKDRESLIRKSCDLLVQRKGYEKAWILLLDGNRKFVAAASTALGEHDSAFLKQLETGDYPVCLRELLAQEQPFIAYDQPGKRHEGCILASEHSRQGVFRCRLEYRGKLYGVLGVAVPSGAVFDKEEQALFLELCGDLAFALANIESEEQRKRVEEELLKLRLAVETSGEAIFLTDRDGTILFINPEFTRLYGYSAAEVVGKTTPRVLKRGRMKPQDYEMFWQTLLNKQVVKGELTNKTKDGRIVDIEGSANPILDDRGNVIGFLAVQRDITERKKMQEQLMAQDRLAAIGQLTSGVAHELNNPLTSVIGFAELLLQRKDLPGDVEADLKVVNDSAMRTARIVKNLLTFARKQPEEKLPLDVNENIERVLELRAYEQKVNNIQVNTRFASDLPQVMGSGFQLQQVFLNIIINAEYFMLEAHQKGNLTITAERMGDFVRVSFADDGPGISPENMGKLFTPFFTTKEVGKGTGLGLSICHGIVAEHGGNIHAESEQGKGATFVVELPISK